MKYIYLTAALLLSLNGVAQQEFTLHTLDHVFQASHTNPAFSPRHKVSVTLGSSFHVNLKNTGFTYNFLASQINTDESGQRVLDLGQLSDNLDLKGNDFVHAGASVDILAVSFKAAKNRFSLNLTEHVHARFNYNDGLLGMLVNGNEPGGITQLGGYKINGAHYRELGLGFNRSLLVDDKLVVGGRLKTLFGLANVNTVRSDVNLQTGTEAEMYEITASSDILVRTAGVDMLENGDLSYLSNTSNIGFGVDLGATYEYTRNLRFAASIINLGGIKWKEGVTTYTSNGEYTFSGIDNNDLFSGSFTFDQTEITDSLQAVFEFEETQESYGTALPTQVYLSAFYRLASNTTASATLYSEFINGFRRGMVLGVNQRVGRWLQTSLTYAMHARSYNNLGFGLAIGTGVQLYAVTDNLLALTNPGGAKMLNFRGGLNFVF